MKNNQLQLVTFEQAKRLKAAGFDWECELVYNERPTRINTACVVQPGNTYPTFPRNNNKYEGKYSAPTVALALKWMRDVKGLTNCVDANKDGQTYWGCLVDGAEWRHTNDFDTYEQAESALLDELLTTLEK